MIAVFKTDIPDQQTAQYVKQELIKQWPNARIDFDLEDCDRILRFQAEHVAESAIEQALAQLNITGVALED